MAEAKPKATLNLAKKSNVGVLVPIIIKSRPATDPVFELYAKNGTTKIDTMKAELHGSYIRITAVEGQKPKTVKGMKIKVADGEFSGTLDLTVANKYPKIIFAQSGPLDRRLKTPVTLTAMGDDGTVFTIESITSAKPEFVDVNEDWSLKPGTSEKKGSSKLTVTLVSDEYDQATKNGKDPTYTAKLLYTNVKDPTPPKKKGQIKAAGKIDILDPSSRIIVALSSDGTDVATSAILDVPEYFQIEPLVNEIHLEGEGKFFAISAKPNSGLDTATKHTVNITFNPGSAAEFKASKPLSIKAVQTSAKAVASRKTVTLFQSIPKYGEELTLSLSSNADARIGYVQVQTSKNKNIAQTFGVDEGKGFEAVQNGVGSWNLKLLNGAALTSGKKVKPSYTVKLELWPEGTFVRNADGSVPLDNSGRLVTNAKAKAAVASVKVGMALN
jgi:hypothetical protein